MSTINQSEADAELVLDIYDYALTHKLDISNKEDIKSILKTLGQNEVNEKRVEQLMTALMVTDKRIRNDVENRNKQIN